MQTKSSAFTVLLCLLFLFIVIFSSCTSKEDSSQKVYHAIEKGLIQSGDVLENQNRKVYNSLIQKNDDPVSHEKASIWLPKAITIRNLSEEIRAYISFLNEELKKEKGPGAVNMMFYEKGKGKELFDKLGEFKSKIFSVDSLMTKEFKHTILIVDPLTDTIGNDENRFVDIFFRRSSPSLVSAILNEFQNNILAAENKMISYCDAKCTVNRDFFDTYSAIVAQNTKYLKQGDQLEITAGVGGFSRACKPQIMINMQNRQVSDEAVATYKVKVSGKPGKYKVPVNIDFIDEDGIKKNIVSAIEYTIIK